MRNLHNYSEIFITEYEEVFSISEFALAMNLTVLSNIQWLDRNLKYSTEAKLQRLAIIWRRHHDVRVIPMLEKALVRGILSPILCVSVRQESLELFLNAESKLEHDVNFNNAWSNVAYCENGEQWSVTVSKASNFLHHNVSSYDDYHRLISTIVYCCGLGHDSFEYRVSINESWISHCLKEVHNIGHEK